MGLAQMLARVLNVSGSGLTIGAAQPDGTITITIDVNTAGGTAQEVADAIDADAGAEATLQSALGLGSAAYTASGDYATAAQFAGLSSIATTGDAANLTGTIDPARLPVLPSQVQVLSSGQTIADLTPGERSAIVKGAIVTTGDGGRWTYTGSGSKTDEASYIRLADVTPEWAVIAGKPTTLSGYGITDAVRPTDSEAVREASAAALTAANPIYADLGAKGITFGEVDVSDGYPKTGALLTLNESSTRAFQLMVSFEGEVFARAHHSSHPDNWSGWVELLRSGQAADDIIDNLVEMT
jgi:hypothetical protein